MFRSSYRNLAWFLCSLLCLSTNSIRASGVIHNLAPSASAPHPCHLLIRTLVPFQRGSSRILADGEVLAENVRVAPAVRDVLSAYERDGIEPPASLGLLPIDSAAAGKWERWLADRIDLPSHVASRSKKITKGSSPVWDVELEGERFAFRVAGEYQDLRLAVAAAEANAFLGLRTVPRARAAIVEGRRGYLFDYVEGAALPALSRGKALRGAIAAKKLSEESYSDAMVFEFLVGNLDADSRNSLILPDGRVQVFDHNYAFAAGLPEYFPNEASLGPVLPQKYTRPLAEKLKSIGRGPAQAEQRKKFLDVLEPHLTPAELRAVEFRLDVILRDLERRGDAAF